MHGLLFKIQYGHHYSPPASQVDHEPHQLISKENLAGWNSFSNCKDCVISGLSFSYVRNVLKNELKWRAWKPHYCQALSAKDCDIRMELKR